MQSVFVGFNRPTLDGRPACRCRGVAFSFIRRLLLAALSAAALSACQPEADTAAPQVRPVRTVTVVKREVGETVSYTGRIQAENETRLAFRISGRMVERRSMSAIMSTPDRWSPSSSPRMSSMPCAPRRQALRRPRDS